MDVFLIALAKGYVYLSVSGGITLTALLLYERIVGR
jgi:hypothetical protein